MPIINDKNLYPDVLERLRHPPTEEYQLDNPPSTYCWRFSLV